MNTKSLSAALALAAGSVFASMSANAAPIATLDTVQVRPSVEQLVQQEHERTSPIATLAAVQVRPSAEQIAEYEAEQAASQRVTTLATVQVRPSAEQRDALLADAGSARSHNVGAEAAALLGQVIVNLPVPHLRPSPSDLEALIGAFGKAAAQY